MRSKKSVAFCIGVALLTVLTPVAAEASFPGKPGRIVLTRVSQNGGGVIASVNPYGGDERVLVQADTVATYPGQTGTIAVNSASWSPDGDSIAFVSTDKPAPTERTMTVKLMRPDGTIAAPSLGSFDDPEYWDPSAAFAPDGGVVFRCSLATICRSIGPGTGTGMAVAQAPSRANSPVFANDGRMFLTIDDQIAVVLPSGAQSYVNGGSGGTSPDISPDGRTLVFVGQGGIYTLPSTGGVPRQLIGDSVANSPAFSPDGSQIAYMFAGDLMMVPASGGASRLVSGSVYPAQDLDWGPLPVGCGGKRATQVGTPGNDTRKGTNGRDVLAGLGGKDKLIGLKGRDTLCGGKGKDKLVGGKGRDKLIQGG